MAHFLLIRHSNSALDFSVPAATWGLSEIGRVNCWQLAEDVRPHQPTLIVTSHEPKAVQTGQIVGDILGIGVKTADNLHEHNRSNVTEMPGDQFKRNVARLFTDPDTLFFGTETGNQARHRFTQAIQTTLATHPHDKLAIVAHGTVITLFLATYNNINPIEFWQSLQMPDLLVINRDTFQLAERLGSSD